VFMKEKKYVVVFLVSVFIVLIGVCFFNYIIDPFYLYGNKNVKPFFDMGISRQINSGLIKNLEFDTVILGSSSIKNLFIEDLEQNLSCEHPLKIMIASGTAHEMYLSLKYAYSKKTIKKVFFVCDVFTFNGHHEAIKENIFPKYLYEEGWGYTHLFSFSALKQSCKVIFNSIFYSENSFFDYRYLYSTFDEEQNDIYNESNLQSAWVYNCANLRPSQFSLELALQNFRYNILTFIKEHPETEFIMVFPAYSIFQYKIIKKEQYFDAFVEFEQKIYDELLLCMNVKLYDFQSAEELIYNKDIFCDIFHSSRKAGQFMLQEISKNNFLVTPENRGVFLNAFCDQVKEP
jgi:hypothetical protein